MNRFDEKYIFRLATVEDIDAIMNFYKIEWDSNHILANDKDFFCYQHLVGKNVNFMLAINKKTHCIEAAEGFIQYSIELKDIAAVMWKASSKSSTPFLGVEVIKRLKEATNCRAYFGTGVNPKTALPLHKNMLKHNVGKLKHFYLLADIDKYKIAIIREKIKLNNISFYNQYKLVEIKNYDELDTEYNFEQNISRKPFKDRWYTEKRYFNHPIYNYLIWVLQDDKKLNVALLIAREVECNSSKVLRIIDYLGDTNAIAGLALEMENLIKRNNYEYIDIYCKGVDNEILNKAGFVFKSESDDNIIPNYFEPFIEQNIDIWYALSDDDTLIFKGDGDQDRPNHR